MDVAEKTGGVAEPVLEGLDADRIEDRREAVLWSLIERMAGIAAVLHDVVGLPALEADAEQVLLAHVEALIVLRVSLWGESPEEALAWARLRRPDRPDNRAPRAHSKARG